MLAVPFITCFYRRTAKIIIRKAMSLIEFHEKLLNVFEKFKVNYMIVGGHAVNIYGYVRATADLDIWIDKTAENLDRIRESLKALGYNETECSKAIEEVRNDKNIALFDENNNKIDIMQLYSTRLSFSDAFFRKKEIVSNGTTIFVIGFDDLIDTKIISGRLRDLNDVQELKTLNELRIRNGIKGDFSI
jgi:hypothetical protein